MIKKKVLFVCTANYYRSVTAEHIFRHWETLDVKSAGTHEWATKVITQEMIDWADIIFVMEHHHKDSILEIDTSAIDKIIVLEIPDIFKRFDKRLIKILNEKVPPYLK